MFNTKYYIKYNSKYTDSWYLLLFLHNFKLKNCSYHRLKIIARDWVKQSWSYRTTALSQRDFIILLAVVPLLGMLWKRCVGGGKRSLNKWNKGRIIEISQNESNVVLEVFSYNNWDWGKLFLKIGKWLSPLIEGKIVPYFNASLKIYINRKKMCHWLNIRKVLYFLKD